MPKRTDADLSPADRLRYQLLLCGLSQRGAARELGIHERAFRRYCAGDMVPRVVDYAMQYLVVRAARKKRTTKRNTRTLEA